MNQSKFGLNHYQENASEFDWLQNHTISIPVKGDDVRILEKPSDFYKELIDGIQTAQRRVVITALYLGVGNLEKQLISELKETIKKAQDNQQKLKVDILLDFCRGSRGAINSRSVLAPLLQKESEIQSDITVSLYHSPLLRGFWKYLLPDRINEVVGLQHIKAYVFDDRVILSGANLSSDYFTNRQDRYIVFDNNSQLSDYFHRLVSAISSFSYHLKSDGDVILSSECPEDPVTGNFDNFITFAKQKLTSITTSYLSSDSSLQRVDNKFEEFINKTNSIDTYVYPSLQIGCFGLFQDQQITSNILKSFRKGSQVTFTSGYFNITDEYKQLIVENSADYNIVVASPEANGFLNSAGISKYIPYVYIHFTKLFHNLLVEKNRISDVKLMEYLRPEWTYHAKGIWYQAPNESNPCLTIIGSSNFGARSITRDLEAQLTIVTSNFALQRRLAEERNNIVKWTQPITANTFLQTRYNTPRLVTAITNLIRHFF